MARIGGPALGLALSAALAACSDDGNAGGGRCTAGETRACACDDGVRGEAVCEDGAFGACACDPGEPVPYRFVTTSLRMPASAGEARRLGFDLDGNGTVDNAIGSLAALAGFGAGAGDAVASGQLIQLHLLETPSLTEAAEARWTVYPGEPTPEPDYSGSGTFAVGQGAAGTLVGRVQAGTFRGGPSAMSISLPFGDGSLPTVLALQGVALEAAVTANGCDGKLGGAIPSGDFEDQFVPVVALLLNAMIAADSGCQEDPPNCGPELAALLGLLDTDGDLAVAPEELLANPLFTSMVRPDVDLNGDGETDAFGVGLGFTCVPASFELP